MLHGPEAFVLHVPLQIQSCSGTLLSVIKRLIHGIDGPIHILGDPAYPFYRN